MFAHAAAAVSTTLDCPQTSQPAKPMMPRRGDKPNAPGSGKSSCPAGAKGMTRGPFRKSGPYLVGRNYSRLMHNDPRAHMLVAALDAPMKQERLRSLQRGSKSVAGDQCRRRSPQRARSGARLPTTVVCCGR